MESKIGKYLKLGNHPVAVLWKGEMPEKAIHFQEGKWGCVVALIKAASKGKVACATRAQLSAWEAGLVWGSRDMSMAG